MFSYDKEELRNIIWAKTGKDPVHVRQQALLVIGEFADGSMGVWRIEDLDNFAMGLSA